MLIGKAGALPEAGESKSRTPSAAIKLVGRPFGHRDRRDQGHGLLGQGPEHLVVHVAAPWPPNTRPPASFIGRRALERSDRVVFDTNIPISALIFPGGAPEAVCRLALGGRIGDRSNKRLTPAPHDGGVETPDAVVIVRVWFEGDPPREFRGRLVEVTDGSSPDRVIAAAATPDGLQDALRAWVEGLTVR